MQITKISEVELPWREHLDHVGARTVREVVSGHALRQFMDAVREFDIGCGHFSSHQVTLHDHELKLRLTVRAEALLNYLDGLRGAGR